MLCEWIQFHLKTYSLNLLVHFERHTNAAWFSQNKCATERFQNIGELLEVTVSLSAEISKNWVICRVHILSQIGLCEPQIRFCCKKDESEYPMWSCSRFPDIFLSLVTVTIALDGTCAPPFFFKDLSQKAKIRPLLKSSEFVSESGILKYLLTSTISTLKNLELSSILNGLINDSSLICWFLWFSNCFRISGFVLK